ncbi:polysaccharide deacetylase family protein [Neobacillus cucumis]|uniref:polysaccharide deacetylase family protein n=1 Tax=Neobacillus cucumis TaxID=1740721 RepID=UPI00203D7390|nr:polysaccharide deacetylase family protein [Neobacillus cucumis]MCM3729376.1 polysaccharide deacetylase family protein [Neobacillus cucumis]
MRNLKKGWSKGTLIVLLAIGFVCIGVFLSHHFQERTINKPINHSKNETIKRAIAKGPAPEENIWDTDEIKLEKERIRKQQVQAIAWRNQQEREKSNVKEPTTTEPAAAKPATNDTASSEQPTKEPKPAQSEQPITPPANPVPQKTVYLTFDDGPTVFSGQIIALLEKYRYKATFFMIDGNIRRYPNAVKLMVQSGETVGLHSVSHNPKIFYASVASIMAELTQNRNTLKEISGVDSYIMRTPYGSVPYMTEEYRKAVHDTGYMMWDWNIDSRDWDYKDARYVNSVITQLNRLANHNGPIVILLHERKETLAHLPQLLDFLSNQGWMSKAIDSSMTPVQFKP